MNTSNRISNFFTITQSLFRRSVYRLYQACIVPQSEDEDDKRHEFILNSILCGIITLVAFLDVFVARAVIREGSSYQGVPFCTFTIVLALFISLLILSRKGYYRIAGFVFIGLYFTSTTYGAVKWGVELPLVAISYIVIIVISSILISTRFGFFVTSIIAITISSICLLQSHGIIHPLLYWKHAPERINDAIELSFVFFIVTTVSWLSNREMEKSLVRARASEHALLEERNLLEIKVEERTKELKETQAAVSFC